MCTKAMAEAGGLNHRMEEAMVVEEGPRAMKTVFLKHLPQLSR